MRYWEKDIETLHPAELKRIQLQRLRNTFESALRSPCYGSLYSTSGKYADRLSHLEDLHEMPFTTKQQLRDNFPYGFLSIPKKEIIRLHSSSGTTGNPTVVFHSRHDINSWANLMARSLFCAGVRDTDVFQNIVGYGLFTGGLGFQYGIEKLGALSIPAGAGNSLRQIRLMLDYGTTVIHAIPSYLGRLHEVINAEGLDPARDLELRMLVIGAEPHTEEQRQRIQVMFGVKAFNSFGLSEMNGPGVAFECEYQNGLHIWEDAFVVEIVHPDTLELVSDGDYGELVMTTLDRQAMPLIRYRTRDITRIIPGDCPCGRTHRRIDRITGRSDDMFIIRGCNVYPMQIEAVLLKITEVGDDYRIRLDTISGHDEMIVEVEVKKEWFRGDLLFLDRLQHRIAHLIRDEVLVRPKVKLVEPGSIPKAEGKAVRVIDTRKKT
jgi:phenylacetate-CoA ligase